MQESSNENELLNNEEGESDNTVVIKKKNPCRMCILICSVVTVSLVVTVGVSVIVAAVVIRSKSMKVQNHINTEPYPHVDDEGYVLAYKENGRWINWWARDKPGSFAFLFGVRLFDKDYSNIPTNEKELDAALPVKRPYWMNDVEDTDSSSIKATWIGHASVLAEFDNVKVLADPIFSQRASMFQWIGPKRYRPPACNISDLPLDLDAIVISHTHYDHLDYNSVQELNQKYGTRLHWFVPKGIDEWLTYNFQINPQNVHSLVWWEEAVIPQKPNVKFAFTPSNHWCKRGAFDDDKQLWGSWSIIGPKNRFWFGGDTAYAYDAFKQIGQKYGPFDLAAIPIGAYNPSWYMRWDHVNPEEAIMIHRDIKSKMSFGMHWGTFKLTNEPWLEPREKLRDLLREKNIPPEEFQVLNIGETVENTKTAQTK